MTARYAHTEPLGLDELAEIREPNISVRFAAEELLKDFVDAHRLVQRAEAGLPAQPPQLQMLL